MIKRHPVAEIWSFYHETNQKITWTYLCLHTTHALYFWYSNWYCQHLLSYQNQVGGSCVGVVSKKARCIWLRRLIIFLNFNTPPLLFLPFIFKISTKKKACTLKRYTVKKIHFEKIDKKKQKGKKGAYTISGTTSEVVVD